MDATGHAALTHVLHDATSSVIKQLRAQLQEKERKLRELDRRLAQATCIRAIDQEHIDRINVFIDKFHVLHRQHIRSLGAQLIDRLAEALCKIDELDRQLARATYIRARQGAKLRRLRRPRINPQATD